MLGTTSVNLSGQQKRVAVTARNAKINEVEFHHLLGYQSNTPSPATDSTPRYLAEDPSVIDFDLLASENSSTFPSSSPIRWYSTVPNSQCHRTIELPYRVHVSLPATSLFAKASRLQN